MPKYVFPNTSSGINVDDHLNDFLLENDLQGIHGHVDPAQSNPIDMNYFRGKIAFHYNAYSSGSGNVEMIYPSASGTGQQIIGGPSNSYKAFLHDIHSSGTFYDSASFVANPDSGYVFKEWRVDSISGSIVGTNAQLDIVVDTTDNYNTSQSFYAIFDGCQLVIEATSQSCALIINGSTPACNVGFTATVSTNTPVAAPTAPTPIPTAPSPIPTAPTPIPTAPSPIPTAPTPIPTAPTPAPAVAPTASPVPAPAVAPTASPVPALAPAKAPVVTPVAVQCYEYDLTSDGGDTVAFTYTRCDGTSQTSTVPNGDSITVCAQSGSVTMNPGSGTIVAGNTCTSGPSPSPAVAPTASPVPAPAAPTPIPTAPSPTSPSPAPTSSVSPQALAPQPAPVTTPTAPTPQPAISPTGSAPTPSPVAPSPSPTAPTPVPNAPTPVPTVAPTASPVPAPITIAPQPAPVTTPTAPTPVPAVAPTGSESIPTPSPLAPSPVPTAPSPIPTAPSPIPTAPSPAPTGTEPTPTVAPRALVTPTSEDPEGPGEPTPSPSPTSGGGGGSPISEGLEPSPEQPNAE